MSKLNITKDEWLELVFEGKNKEYGAYQLRKEDGATTTKAFFTALVFVSALVALPILLSSFGEKPTPETIYIDDPELVLHRIDLPKIEEPKVTAPPKTKAQPPIKTETLVNPTVVKAEEAPDVDFTKPEDVGKPNTENTNTNGNTSGTGTNTNSVVTNPSIEPADDGGNKIETMVEKNPNFPGGINEFLKLVGNRFAVPELDEERTLKVIVFFVVEKDGTLSNITVPRSPGYGLDKEAIRVLKSIKTKWEPGILRGNPVRTQYSLPIVVKTQ
ncbi:energy transducer TonB [Flavobacterium terrae]|uniref:Outer membrane transport energization protein TonB n=1 Tax=Flavobacterium terrae TaxID=415425 RepID=A0A1M6D7V2_9FLAO|nr:energy transducer TonB [Flavobacterium terrae]SHI69302.1 outer membrane transport energization protein TonB [Flavobacterium terrae]